MINDYQEILSGTTTPPEESSVTTDKKESELRKSNKIGYFELLLAMRTKNIQMQLIIQN